MKTRYLSLFLISSVSSVLAAQQPAAARMKPEETEFWTPVPPVVTPGRTSSEPPTDAIVLIGKKDLNEWRSSARDEPARWLIDDGIMTVDKKAGDIKTKRTFRNYQLHVEWRVPVGITGNSQARGNSGIFLGTLESGSGYELQVLDSYENRTYSNGQAGSIYKQSIPLANAMRKPGEWNEYDVVWNAPIFNADGTLALAAHVTVLQNGVLMQNHFALRGPTEYIGLPSYKAHGAVPIQLQAHGDPSAPVSFRNMWLRELP